MGHIYLTKEASLKDLSTAVNGGFPIT